MASPPKPEPRRQDSAVSSASSGNRTVRASSNQGRRRSLTSTSTATVTATASGLLARLTGRRRGRRKEDGSGGSSDKEEEISDNGSPTPSPGPMVRLEASAESEAGPSDYWRRTPSPRGSPVPSERADTSDGKLNGWRSSYTDVRNGEPTTPPSYPHRPRTDAVETPEIERRDDNEYERRLEWVLAHSPVDVQESQFPNKGNDMGYFAEPPDTTDSGVRRGLDAGIREALQWRAGKELAEKEELGVLEFPLRVRHTSFRFFC